MVKLRYKIIILYWLYFIILFFNFNNISYLCSFNINVKQILINN
jgi:hypothetical protein